jgi:hypothetical protein
MRHAWWTVSVRRSTLLLTAIIGFGVLYLAASLVRGTPPTATESGARVVAWFHHHAGNIRLWLWLLTVATPVFALFAALVRRQLPEPYGSVFFFGAVVFAVETAIQGWIWAGIASHANGLQPATARTLLDIANFWGPVLTSATMITLAPVVLVALRGGGGLPRWLGILAAVAFVEQAAETITIFGRGGFIAPGGPMNALLGAGLVAAAWLGLGVSLAGTISE